MVPKPTRPTIADVGREAGVSQTTVSLVLNDRAPKIPAATQERVIETAARLGYRPNRAAQSLRTGLTHTIAFLTDEIAVGGFSGPMIAGLHELAWERDSMLLMVNSTRNPRRIRAAIDNLVDRRVDALVFAAMGTRPIDLPSVLKGVPTVLVNAFTEDGRLPAILPDEYGGGRSAVEHLLAQGHERIALLAGLKPSWATGRRVEGFRDGLTAAGYDPDAYSVRYGNYRVDSGYHLTREVMLGTHPPTALLMGNDQMATGAYLALGRMGIEVPEDVAVVGYDDEPIASALSPALTSVRIPFYEMGRMAGQYALDGTISELPPITLVPCVVVPRASANDPRGG